MTRDDVITVGVSVTQDSEAEGAGSFHGRGELILVTDRREGREMGTL